MRDERESKRGESWSAELMRQKEDANLGVCGEQKKKLKNLKNNLNLGSYKWFVTEYLKTILLHKHKINAFPSYSIEP